MSDARDAPTEVPMTSAHPRRLAALAASLAATLVLSASVPGPGDGRWERLRAMPREERVRLAGKLKAFDALSPAEQQAVRALDEALAAEPGENRSNYYAVLHRYHLWLDGLTDAQKSELAAHSGDARLALVTRLIRAQRGARRPAPFLQEIAEFGGVSPYDLADSINVWLKLTPAERAEVERQNENQRRTRLQLIALNKRIKSVARPKREEIDALFERFLQKNRRPAVAKKADEKMPKYRQHVAEYWSFMEKPPAPVKPESLQQFDRALPVWLRTGIDDAPPDEARWLLTNLYRLVFPAGTEFEPPRAGTAQAVPNPRAPVGAPTPARPGAPVPAVPRPKTPPPPPKPEGASRPF